MSEPEMSDPDISDTDMGELFSATEKLLFPYCNLDSLFNPLKAAAFVTLGKRRVVEDGLDEVIDLAAEDHYRLPDVEQFRRTFSDDVYAEQEASLPMEN